MIVDSIADERIRLQVVIPVNTLTIKTKKS